MAYNSRGNSRSSSRGRSTSGKRSSRTAYKPRATTRKRVTKKAAPREQIVRLVIEGAGASQIARPLKTPPPPKKAKH